MNTNQTNTETSGYVPLYISTSIPDLSSATIGNLQEKLNLTSESRVTILTPAGANRRLNLKPAIMLASALSLAIEGLHSSVRISVDRNELNSDLLKNNYPQHYPEIAQLQLYLPKISAGNVSVRLRTQEVSNSVVEVTQAMQEACHSQNTHLLIPRHSWALSQRVSRGVRHALSKMASQNPLCVSIAQHSIAEEGQGTKQKVLELASYLLSEATYLANKNLYENLLERKGIFGRAAKIAQNFKLKQF